MPTEGRFGYVSGWRNSESSSSSSNIEYVETSSSVQEGGDSEDFAGGDSPDSDD